MRLAVLLAALLLPALSVAKDPACAKNCNDLLKSMAADCRRAEKGEGPGHKGGDHHNDAEACQASLKKMQTACMKDCTTQPKKKR